jgi:hypothetical protein
MSTTLTPKDYLALAALYKQWVIADAIRVAIGHTPRGAEEAATKFGPSLVSAALQQSTMARLEVWYALLYVVVEGYKELGYRFESLDSLLAAGEYMEPFRRFRNATFHYQEDPFSAKLVDFLAMDGSEHWVKEVNKRLEAFFTATLPIDEMLQTLGGEGETSH